MKLPPLPPRDAQQLYQGAQRFISRPLDPKIFAHGYTGPVVIAPSASEEQRAFVETQLRCATQGGSLQEACCDYVVPAVAKPHRWLNHPVLFQEMRTYLRASARVQKSGSS